MEKAQLEKTLKNSNQESYLWARQCCHYDDELAKEVLQAVYLKIFEGRARYNEKSSFRTWLFAVIRYTAIDSLKATRHHSDLDEAMTVPEEPPPEETDYQAMLQQLPEQQAHVLLLAFYHGMTLEAISAVMGIGIGTVRTHYERGKKKLKELIEKKQLQDYGR